MCDFADQPFALECIEKYGRNQLGCVATRDIKPGEIVLDEICQVPHPNIPRTNDLERQIFESVVIDTFNGLSEDDREMYLNLHNCFEFNGEVKDDGAIILEIFKSNSIFFGNGVGIQLSRFNHSCQSNAEVWVGESTCKGIPEI